jgi:acyl-CoA reductase-like NAD-dependent aldehyde dehydrogenase
MEITIPTLENYINGNFQPPKDINYIHNVNPTNGTTTSMIPKSNISDICQAVDAAKEALNNPNWNYNYISQRTRSEWLSRIADGLESRLEIFAQAESLDTGNFIKSIIQK